MDEAILGAGGVRGSGRTNDGWRGDGRDRRGRGRVRLTPAMLVVLLLAALCPLVPATPAGADGVGSIQELPAGFQPNFINNNGQIAGLLYGDGPTRAMVWSDGQLTELGGPAYRVHDFNDAGQAAVQMWDGTSSIEIRGPDGTRVLQKPVVGGEAKDLYRGWAPSESGEVIATRSWDSDTKSNGVRYQGAGPPTLITEVATVFAANQAGQIFGQLDTDPASYAMLDNGALRGVSGYSGKYMYPTDFSNAGHVLYISDTGRHVWHEGSSTPITEGTPLRVNAEGVVLLQRPMPTGPSTRIGLRFDNGEVTDVRDLVGGAPDWKLLYRAVDLNDECTVVGQGQTIDDRYAYFVAEVPKCEPVDIEGEFFRTDGGSPYVKIDDDADVRLRVENSSGSDLTNVTITEATVDVEEPVEGEDPPGRAELTDNGGLSPTTLAASGPESVAFADFTLKGIEAGTVTLRAEISANKGGETVSGTIEREFEVRQEDLQVNLTLDPPEYEEAEDGTFEPVDITATVSFTNNTGEDMTDIRLQELEVDRVFTGQGLHVEWVSGIKPDPIDPEVIVTELEAGKTSEEFTAVFRATDDGTVEFSALATAAAGDRTVAGIAKQRWKAKVKKFVEITSTVTNPEDNELLNAGGQIIIDGTVENLTTNFDVTLGPLYPTLVGNTGTMNLAYDGNAANPNVPVPAEPLELEPGQKRTFQVRITTNYSDPRMYEAQPSGGTRAYATFEPWGEAIERQDPDLEGQDPPEKVDIRTYEEASPGDGSQPGEEPDAQVKADPTDLFKRISIDDSIELPPYDRRLVAAGIIRGAAEGMVNAAIAAVESIPDLVKLPYTILVGAYDYQAKVWESFTEEEKDLFLTETSFLIVSILQRNVEFGLRDGKQLYDDVYKLAGDQLTKMENDWAIGDYEATTQGYSAFLSEAIGSVAGPVILSKMAKSPRAVAALERWQAAVNARMASTFASANNLKYVDNVLPVLQAIENGAEPTLTAIAKLWGITPEEIAEYKRICGIIGCIATVRSRHVSSSEWIKKWGALLKPENLKIKTVNELDVLLGYDVKDLGSLIFRKPELVKQFFPKSVTDDIAAAAKAAGEATGRPQGSEAYRDAYNKVLKARRKAIIEPEARDFARSKGFKEGTKEYAEAVKRLEDRADEWFKHSAEYKQWNDRGWIDTTFNYEGNAIPEYKYKKNPDTGEFEVVGKLTGADKGNYKGFRMVEKTKGSDEYIVQMFDAKTGKWRRITGDIDPVDFTYTDGGPLSPEDHALLMKLLQESPIGAEHGYTATFKGFMDKNGNIVVKPGPELVKKQFKPNEPALQIAPGDAPPRAARIDVENSRWVDSDNYNMRWVNGFVDAGTKRSRGIPESVDADFDMIPNTSPEKIALPVKTKPPEPTLGRFVIKYANEGETAALIMGANGRLQSVNPDGTTQDSPLNDQAFTEGPIETITVAPASTLENDPVPEPPPAPLKLFGFGGRADAPARTIGTGGLATFVTSVVRRVAEDPPASSDAGSKRLRVSTAPGFASGENGFAAGQVLAVGVGSDDMELVEVAGVDDGVITLTEPLDKDHRPDEIALMVVSADGVPVDPDKGVDPKPEPGDGGGGDGGSGDGKGDGDGSGTGNGGNGAAGAATVADGSGTSGNGASSSRGSSSTSGSSAGGSSSGTASDARPLAYTGANSLRMVYLGGLLALLGLALAAWDRRRRRIPRVRPDRGEPR